MSLLEADDDVVRGIPVDTLLKPATFEPLHLTDPSRLTRSASGGFDELSARAGHSFVGERGGGAARTSGLQDFKLSKDAAAALFETSRPVGTLSFFVSHSWRAPGAAKRTALAFYLNGYRAALGATLTAVGLATLSRFEVLPSGGGFRDEGLDARLRLGVPWGLLGGVLAFELLLARAHAWGRPDARTAFVDKLCVHQDDEYEDAEGNSLKAKAIRSFAGLVRRSERLVILLDPTYFERLWCVLLGDGRARVSGMKLRPPRPPPGASSRRPRSSTSTAPRTRRRRRRAPRSSGRRPSCCRSRSSRW